MKSAAFACSLLVVFLSLLTSLLSTTPARAQEASPLVTFTVNTFADAHDAHPGDGTCADKQGKCSVRAAIEEADALPTGSSILITVPAGTYGLRLGTLGLTANTITITGASSQTTIIRGNHTFTLMTISATVSAHLNQLTLERGHAGSSGYGGGIFSEGSLSVSNSVFSSNTADQGGGIDNYYGMLSVTNSAFSGNSAAGSGGGIENVGGTLTVANSAFRGNVTGHSGGAIHIFSGTLTMSNSTISNNVSRRHGGGIVNYYGTVSVSNSTISDNTADGNGGGIVNDYGGAVSVSNSTISSNLASNGASGIFNRSGTFTLTGSIISNTPVSNCARTITDNGYNLDNGTTCGFTRFSLNNTDPLLGPLGNNGGPTQTMALLQGSPAIDQVALSSCPATDQRGYVRPDNSESTCDIGAYESAY